MFGLPFPTIPPKLALRSTIRLFVALPHEWTLPLVGASEVVGCILFRRMRDEGVRLFANDPPVADRIARFYDEILADEVGHVGFIAAKLSPGWRAITRFSHERSPGAASSGALRKSSRCSAGPSFAGCSGSGSTWSAKRSASQGARTPLPRSDSQQLSTSQAAPRAVHGTRGLAGAP
jgi:hypothetical protein